jgi:hypothetical protein
VADRDPLLRIEFCVSLDSVSTVGSEFTSGEYDAKITLRPESVEEARAWGAMLDRHFKVTIEEMPEDERG